MKRFLTLASLFVTVAAPAFATVEPNSFSCTDGVGHYDLEFATTSRSGEARMQVVFEGVSVVDVQKDDSHLSTTATTFGTLATLSVLPKLIADVPSTVYGVFIPRIPSINPGAKTEFDSTLLIGRAGGHLHPAFPQSQITEAVSLKCEARHSDF